MSWMDSWSRPSKSQAIPPPFYLTNPSTKYCHTCGRLISDRRTHKSTTTTTPAKYCSVKCRAQKPRTRDFKIEEAFAALLNGLEEYEGEKVPSEIAEAVVKTKAKGEKRVVVPCSAVEILVFGPRSDPTKTHGRKKNRASRALGSSVGEWRSVDMESDSENDEADDVVEDFETTGFAGKVRPPQERNAVNGSVGGEKGRAERTEESEEALAKRLEGQKVANEKEMIKRGARRLCVFGFAVEEGSDGVRRKCEAVMNGKVVEPSFAKGDWGVRWRE